MTPFRNMSTIDVASVPSSLAIPTCDHCGNEWIDPKTAEALDEALQGAYAEELHKRLEAALATIASAEITQRRLEQVLGLSLGYLSRVRAKRGDAMRAPAREHARVDRRGSQAPPESAGELAQRGVALLTRRQHLAEYWKLLDRECHAHVLARDLRRVAEDLLEILRQRTATEVSPDPKSHGLRQQVRLVVLEPALRVRDPTQLSIDGLRPIARFAMTPLMWFDSADA